MKMVLRIYVEFMSSRDGHYYPKRIQLDAIELMPNNERQNVDDLARYGKTIFDEWRERNRHLDGVTGKISFDFCY